MNALHRLLGRLREQHQPLPREYEQSPHHDPILWCYHEDGRKHLPDDAVLPCPLGPHWVLCGVSAAGVCWRPFEHPGRHSNGQRTWPNDGPVE